MNKKTKLFFVFTLSLVFSVTGLFALEYKLSIAQIFELANADIQNANSAGPIAINFSTQNFVMQNFSHTLTNEELIFQETGWYMVNYGCTFRSNNANNRHNMENYLTLNGTEVVPSRSTCYIRGSPSDGDTCSNFGSVLVNASTGSLLRLHGERQTGTSAITNTNRNCWINSYKMIDPMLHVYDDVGGQEMHMQTVTVYQNATVIQNTTSFTRINETHFSVLDTGHYRIAYTSCSNQVNGTSNVARHVPFTHLLLNDSFVMQPSESMSYLRRQGAGGRNCEEAVVLTKLGAGSSFAMRKGIFDRQSTTFNVEPFQNQVWTTVEHLKETDYMYLFDTTGGVGISSGTTPVSFNVVGDQAMFIENPNVQTMTPLISGMYEVTYNMGWNDAASSGRRIVCAYVFRNGTFFEPSQQCDYSRGGGNTGQNGGAASVIMNLTAGETVQLVINTTIGVVLQSNQTWISLRKLKGNAQVIFDENTLDAGTGVFNGAAPNATTTIMAYRNNTNVNLACIAGNCADVFVNETSFFMQGFTSRSLRFSCSNQTVQSMSAIYAVTSDEDISQDTLNISCVIVQSPGVLNGTMLEPIELTTKRVSRYKLFNVSAQLSCSGTAANRCDNVSVYAAYRALFGNGKDGARVVTSTNTVVNNYTYLTVDVNSGVDTITLNQAGFLSLGDEVLIVQMQNGSEGAAAGTYEFVTVKNVMGSVVELDTALINSYTTGTFNTTLASVTQVLRVPHYTVLNVSPTGSIVAQPWDGYSGGIVAFRAQDTLETQGFINVSAQGYRGGSCGGCNNNDFGEQGEGYLGTGVTSLSRNANGGGGGYGLGSLNGEAGGGGGHATNGDNAVGGFATQASGGSSIGSANLQRIFMGGGAGAGGDNDNQNPDPELVHGGGIVIGFARNIINARAYAQGAHAIDSATAGGTSGAGAGGTIWLMGTDVDIGAINASGGRSATDGSDIGGAGGTGRVRVDRITLTGATPDPAIGHTQAPNTYYNHVVSNVSSDIPFTTTNIQPSPCYNMIGGQNCSVSWLLNGTGEFNQTYEIYIRSNSSNSLIAINTSEVSYIVIVNDTQPTVTLYHPLNNSNYMSNGSLLFNWSIIDDSITLNCSLFLENQLNETFLCNSSRIIERIKLSGQGYRNWSLNITDEFNNSVLFDYRYFLVYYQNKSATKSLVSENTDQYRVLFSLTDLMQPVIDVTHTIMERLGLDYTFGSFTRVANITNTTSSSTIFGWYTNVGQEYINYSISSTQEYSIRDQMIIGLE